MLPRPMGAAAARQSSRVGQETSDPCLQHVLAHLPLNVEEDLAHPEQGPMIIGTRPTPSFSVSVPKVKRATPEIGSMPTVPRSMPSSAMAAVRSFEPPLGCGRRPA